MMAEALHYKISHVTRYLYPEPVSLCHNIARLTPRRSQLQSVLDSSLTISPQPAIRTERIDFFRNPTTDFTIQDPHRELTLTANHEILVQAAEVQQNLQSWESIRTQLSDTRDEASLEASQFRFESPLIPTSLDYLKYALKSFLPNRPIQEAAWDLTKRIHRDFLYDPQATTVTTTVSEVFKQRRGVCQDFAHFQIACLRSLGLAARYVSGYLATTPPPGRPRLIGADASHAWVSVYCGADGWVEFDPTNASLVGNRHILLATGRDYQDVSPVKGVILGGGQHRIEVSVDARVIDSVTQLDSHSSQPV
jgi:transglutaminase-like putative cysteine protease